MNTEWLQKVGHIFAKCTGGSPPSCCEPGEYLLPWLTFDRSESSKQVFIILGRLSACAFPGWSHVAFIHYCVFSLMKIQVSLSAGHSNESPGHHSLNEIPSWPYFSPCQSCCFQFSPNSWRANLLPKSNRFWSHQNPSQCVTCKPFGSYISQKE